jgi:hypothetical protein
VNKIPTSDQIRVEIFPPANLPGASVTTFFDADPEFFKHPDDLPQWIQERIAVLKVAGGGQYIEGVGQQLLTLNVFWIDVELVSQ